MNLASIRACWEGRSRWEKTALVVWGLILALISVRAFCWPEEKTVYPIYSASGALWWNGTDIYAPYRPESVQGGYRYSPAFAILCTPFAILPDQLGGPVWRLMSAAALLGSLGWLASVLLPTSLSRDQFAWLVLLCVPLSIQSLNNGQANIVVAAALVASIVAVKQERWNLASALIGLAFACKIYPLALGLLLMVLYPRRLGWRVPLAVAFSLIMPFAFQEPVFVLDQYRKWLALLIADDRSQIALDAIYRDLWLLIRLFDLPITRTVYVGLQLLAGTGIALVCWHRQRTGWRENQLLISTLALATAWMMLLGPATESCTFILLAPSLAWSIVQALQTNPLQPRHWLLWGSVSLFASVVLAASLKSTVGIHAVGIHSWASLLYFAYVLAEPTAPAKKVTQAPATPRPMAA